MSTTAILERLLEVRDAGRALVRERTTVDVFAKLGYTPTEKQAEFHAATEFDVLYGGAAGGGKTFALVAEGIRRAATIPDLRVLLVRRTYDEIVESCYPVLAKLGYAAVLGARWNRTEHEMTFPNRSVIRFRYSETFEDATRRQGGEYQLLLVDEATLLAPGIVDFYRFERLRSSGGVPVIGVRSSANPGGVSHGHVKARYIDATDRGKQVIIDHDGSELRFIPSKASDNPHLDAGYHARLDAIPDPARRAAMRDGDWDSFAGQVFSEWRHERHVVEPFPMPVEWPRYVGIDYGYRAPWAAIWGAKDPDGRLWLYRELYATQVGEREQARRILLAESLGGDPTPARAADPSMWAKAGTAMPVASQYSLEGCHLVKADNDRLNGWQRLHTYLAEAPACAMHRELGWDTCPMLHVLDGACPNLVRTLPSAPYDPHRTEDLDTHYEDHVLDGTRYLCMSIHRGAELIFGPDDHHLTAALDGGELYHDIGGGVAVSMQSLRMPGGWDDERRPGGTQRAPWLN